MSKARDLTGMTFNQLTVIERAGNVITTKEKQKYARSKKQTNADRIRNMNDTELAKFLEKVESCGYKDSSITTFENGQYMDMLEWLQAEVKEGEL